MENKIMADINIDGIVTWLKGWFYDKSDVDTIANSKANLNQGQANKNVVTNGSGEITVEDKPVIPTDISNLTDTTGVIPTDVSDLTDTNNTAFTPKAHSHGQITSDGKITSTAVTVASGDNIVITDASDSSKIKRVTNLLASHIKDSSAYTHIGTSANATQSDINSAIDTAISNLSSIQAIQIVTTLPTASSSTMGKLYIISENSKVNVYYTEQNGTSYSWHKMDTDILDELSIDWADVQNKPTIPTDVSDLTDNSNTPFTPKSHSHGQITNDGKLAPTGTTIASDDKILITDTSNSNYIKSVANLLASQIKDSNSHNNIGSSASATQSTINSNIDAALGTKGALTDDVDWTYSDNGFTNGVKLVSKTDNANGRITLHLKS